jgi:hypothetical protein
LNDEPGPKASPENSSNITILEANSDTMPLNPKPLKIILLVLFITASILNSNAQEKGDPPSVKPGLEIKRSELIKRITESDSTMMFKRYGDVNGKPNFIGIAADKTSLQLVGEEDYLVFGQMELPVYYEQRTR